MGYGGEKKGGRRERREGVGRNVEIRKHQIIILVHGLVVGVGFEHGTSCFGVQGFIYYTRSWPHIWIFVNRLEGRILVAELTMTMLCVKCISKT